MVKINLYKTINKMRLPLSTILATTLIVISLPGQSSQMLAAPREAPDFTLSTLEGNSASLSDFQGKLVLLNFWSTHCPPCRAEMPYFEELFREGNEDLIILCVDVGENVSRVKDFARRNNFSLTILLDTNGRVARSYRVRFTPTTLLIDEQSKISKTKIGPFRSIDELRNFALS